MKVNIYPRDLSYSTSTIPNKYENNIQDPRTNVTSTEAIGVGASTFHKKKDLASTKVNIDKKKLESI